MRCVLINILEVEQQDADVWGNIYRSIMWSIAKGVLELLDGFFDVIDKIWRYEFFNNEYVNKIFSGALIVAGTWLILKVMIELVLNHIIQSDERSSPLSIYKGVFLAIVMMFLIPSLFTFGHDVCTSLTDSVISVSGMNSKQGTTETSISNALIKSMIYEDEMKQKDIDYLVKNWKTVDITESEGGIAGIGDKYVYSVNLFMLVVLSILTIFLLFFVAIQIAKRVMEIALFKIIGPFCATGLTNNQSQAFSTWLKSTMGLFLITVVQFVSLGLLINLFGTAIKDNGSLAGIFLIIGALLFIISTPTLISSLLGQQSGLMTGFGDIQSMMAMSHGVGAGLTVATGGVAGAVSVVPKIGGHIGGIGQRFDNYKSGGSGNFGALGKTVASEVSMPFVNAYQKARENFNSLYENSKSKSASPFNFSTSNPYEKPHSVQFNPIRSEYQEQSGNELNNRRWY